MTYMYIYLYATTHKVLSYYQIIWISPPMILNIDNSGLICRVLSRTGPSLSSSWNRTFPSTEKNDHPFHRVLDHQVGHHDYDLVNFWNYRLFSKTRPVSFVFLVRQNETTYPIPISARMLGILAQRAVDRNPNAHPLVIPCHCIRLKHVAPF